MMGRKSISTALLVMISCITLAQTSRITFSAPMAYPEGIAYHPGKKLFYVSSVTTGAIGAVDEKGTYRVIYQDSSLKSSYGMKVDAKRNKLWVCTGDANYSRYRDSATYKKMVRLIGIDLTNGKKSYDINLSNLIEGKHFANDLTLDDMGNIYITDSYSPVIYKIDTQMKAAIFAKSDLFQTKEVGLNGIAWNPQGFLIVAHNTNGQLYKIEVAQPDKITKVQTTTFFPGADGLLWDAAGNLVLVQNKGVHKVFQLYSTDNWQSAQPKAYTLLTDRLHHPTTTTIKDGKVYVLNSKMNELTDPTIPPSKMFSVQEARFVPTQ